jgi:hypothetical protein
MNALGFLNSIIPALGGRRFLMTIGCGAATTALQAAGKLDPAGTTYAMVVIGTVGAYITGNTYQKVKSPGQTDATAAG